MRIANVRDRLAVLTPDGAMDVATASAGKFGPDPQTAFDDWAAFRDWAETASGDAVAFTPEDLRAARAATPPGIRHRPELRAARARVRAAGARPRRWSSPSSPARSPDRPGEIVLSGETVDWEVELVAVVGADGAQRRRGRRLDVRRRPHRGPGPLRPHACRTQARRRSSAWASPIPGFARSGRRWSPRTSSPTRTTCA